MQHRKQQQDHQSKGKLSHTACGYPLESWYLWSTHRIRWRLRARRPRWEGTLTTIRRTLLNAMSLVLSLQEALEERWCL